MQPLSELGRDGEKLYEQAAEATRDGSKSFYFATRFFPRDLARAAHAVYWFCRTTDDLVDENADRHQAELDLESWAVATQAALAGRLVQHPELRLFARVVRDYGIPHEYPLELIEGMRMDLRCTRYRTFDELRVFCYRAASVVGLMMMHVIGYSGRAAEYAIDLGIALQLTNILRDVGEDLERGRIYLPAEEMERFGYAESDLLRRVHNAQFVELMRFQRERARRHYDASMPGIALLHPQGRFAVEIAALIYAAILRRIEANGFDVFSRRAVVPPVEKYWITARTLALPAFRSCLGRR